MLNDNKSNFSDVQVIMVSPESVDKIKLFVNTQNLQNLSFLKVVRDYDDVFSKEFDATTFPYNLIYSKEGNLIKRHAGQLNLSKIYDLIDQE